MVRRLAPILLGLCISLAAPAQTPAPSSARAITFDVVSIRLSTRTGWTSGFTPDGYRASGATLQWMISSDAYGIPQNRLSGGPDWFNTARFEVEAKVAESDVKAYQHLTSEQRRQMLQTMLAGRFHLVVHLEPRPPPVYELVVAKGGSKLALTPPERQHSNSMAGATALFKVSRTGTLEIENGRPEDLTRWLAGSGVAGRFVVDRTGLAGRYDIKLRWTPDNTSSDSPLAGGPSIFTALQEQLGLKLEPATAPIEFLVIDHAEQPTEN